MSWLLFLDESGHDHKTTPYEVRGGIAISAGNLWPFVRAIKDAEREFFGVQLHEFRTELKGARLLDKDRFTWAAQASLMSDDNRQALCRRFLTKGLEKKPQNRLEFAAYGQASLAMAKRIFALLEQYGAQVLAGAISCAAKPEPGWEEEEYLRKDQVFLLERYFYLLEREQQHGLIVMDETEKREDRKFVRRLERYFSDTQTGRERTLRIVPTPFFVSSDMAYPVQVADVCIYCVNWGYRLPKTGMDAPVRQEIAREFSGLLGRVQLRIEACKDGQEFLAWGIFYVPNPYGRGKW